MPKKLKWKQFKENRKNRVFFFLMQREQSLQTLVTARTKYVAVVQTIAVIYSNFVK